MKPLSLSKARTLGIRMILMSNNFSISGKLFHQAFVEFRKFCLESEGLPVDLHIIFADILQNAGKSGQYCVTVSAWPEIF